VTVAVPVGEAHDRDAPAHPSGQAVYRLARGGRECGAQQQVLRRVPGDRELRDQRDVRAGLGRVGQCGVDERRVPVDVTDDGVELGQRDAQGRISVFVADPGLRGWPRAR
jgi:hypothetical protein